MRSPQGFSKGRKPRMGRVRLDPKKKAVSFAEWSVDGVLTLL